MSHCSLGLSCEPINESKTSGETHFCGHGRFRLTCEWCLIEIMQKDIIELKEKINNIESALENHWQGYDLETARFKDKLEKLEFYMNIENRITASDVIIDLNALGRNQVSHAIEIHNFNEYNKARISEIKDLQESIKKLESHYYSDGDLSAIHGQLDNIHYSHKHYDCQLDKLQKQISNWEEEFYFLKDKLFCTDKKPHKCPVCMGIKILIDPATPMSGIQAMFGKRDENGMYYKDCHSCDGKGIVWG